MQHFLLLAISILIVPVADLRIKLLCSRVFKLQKIFVSFYLFTECRLILNSSDSMSSRRFFGMSMIFLGLG